MSNKLNYPGSAHVRRDYIHVTPAEVKKIIPHEFIDIGQGIFEVAQQINRETEE